MVLKIKNKIVIENDLVIGIEILLDIVFIIL